MNGLYKTIADVLETWLTSQRPVVFARPSYVQHWELGPGKVITLGGPPASAKTSFVAQTVFDVLLRTSALKACYASTEVPPNEIIAKQISRLSRTSIDTIRYHRWNADDPNVQKALDQLSDMGSRVVFPTHPNQLSDIKATVVAQGSDIVVLDYLQQIRSDGAKDPRGNVNSVMDFARWVANAGGAVIVVTSLSRSRDDKGRSTYHPATLSMANFRESGEIEYGTDEAYLLTRDPEDNNVVTLKSDKTRYQQTGDVTLTVDWQYQSFREMSDHFAY